MFFQGETSNICGADARTCTEAWRREWKVVSEQCGESLCESALAVGLVRGGARASCVRAQAKSVRKRKREIGQSLGRALSDGAAMTHLRLRRREADLEGKGTDSGREHSRLRFCGGDRTRSGIGDRNEMRD